MLVSTRSGSIASVLLVASCTSPSMTSDNLDRHSAGPKAELDAEMVAAPPNAGRAEAIVALRQALADAAEALRTQFGGDADPRAIQEALCHDLAMVLPMPSGDAAWSQHAPIFDVSVLNDLTQELALYSPEQCAELASPAPDDGVQLVGLTTTADTHHEAASALATVLALHVVDGVGYAATLTENATATGVDRTRDVVRNLASNFSSNLAMCLCTSTRLECQSVFRSTPGDCAFVHLALDVLCRYVCVPTGGRG